jgi:hypothetical protein
MSATEFELDGRRFELKPLSPEDSCLGLEILGRALGPAVVLAFGASPGPVSDNESAGSAGSSFNPSQLVQALLTQASQLAALLKLFVPRTKFDRAGNGNLVELQLFSDEVFGGRIDLTVAFLIHAVRAEYARALGGNSVLAQLVTPLPPRSADPAPTPRLGQNNLVH